MPFGGIRFRSSDCNNGFIAAYNDNGPLTLYRDVGGARALLGAAFVPSPTGRTQRLEVVLDGPSITVYSDGVLKIQATDTFNQTVTRHGLYWVSFYDYTSTYDNFSVLTLPAPVVAQVVATAAAPAIEVGTATTVSAQASDAANVLIPGTGFHWSLSDSMAATLVTEAYYTTSPATIRGLLRTVTVTATAPSGVSGSLLLSVDTGRTLLFDSFTGTTGTLLTAHTPDLNLAGGVWTIPNEIPAILKGGQVGPSATDASTFHNGALIDTGTADGAISVDWTGAASGTYWAGSPIGGIAFRTTDENNGFVAMYNNNGPLSLYRTAAGTATQLAWATVPSPVGRTQRLEVVLNGPSIKVYSDGVLKIEATDPFNQTVARHGLRWYNMYDYLSTYDNFAVRALSATPVAHVVVAPALSIEIGAATTVSAQAFDAANALIPGIGFHWSLSDSTAGTLVTDAYYTTTPPTIRGLLRTVTVTATSPSGVSGSTSVSVDTARTILFDSFSGSTGTLLTAHAPDLNVAGGVWTIPNEIPAMLQGGQVGPSATDASTFHNGALIDTGTADGAISVDWTGAASGTYWAGSPIGGISFRTIDEDNGFSVTYNNNGPLSLYRTVWGTATQLAWATVPSPAGRTQRLEVVLNGPGIKVYSDGVLKIEATDPFNQTVARHGLRWYNLYDYVSTYDNFAVRALSTTPVASVVVTPASAAVEIGDTQVLTAQAFDASNTVIPGALFRWTTSDPTAATLVAQSFFASSVAVHGVKDAVTITATVPSGASASATLTADTSHTRVYDSFSAADGTPLAGHAPDVNNGGGVWGTLNGTQPVVRSSRLVPGGPDAVPLINGAVIQTGVADGTIGVDWAGATAGTASGHAVGALAFRWHDYYNYLFAQFQDSTVSLVKVVDNQSSVLGSATVSPAQGRPQRLQVSLNGPTIDVRADGALTIHATDFFNASETVHGLHWLNNDDAVSAYDNFSVRGTPPCVASLTPAQFAVPAAGGWGAVTVSAPAGCAWSVWVDAPWVTLLTPASGTGSGAVGYYASANTTAPNTSGAGRTATVLVGGRVVSVVQPPLPNPCWASVSSGDTSFPADGGWRAFAISTPLPVCTWTVTTDADWITIVDGAGAGGAAPRYGVAPNPTTEARAGSITVNGYPFNVSQFAGPSTGGGDGGSCVGGVFPSAASWAGDGGQGSITVSALDGCSWTASSTASWVTPVTATGAGSAMLGYTVQPNASETARTATLTVGTATVLVTQDVAGTTSGGGGSSCVTSVAASQTSFASSGGTGTAIVSAANGCAWSASSPDGWISVNASGSGSGSFSFSIAPDPEAGGRSGRILVGDRIVTVAQSGQNSCPQPNGNDLEPDDDAIQCLLDQGETITLNADVTYGYRIAGRPGPRGPHSQGLVLRRNGTILTSSSSWGYRALLFAEPELDDVLLRTESPTVSGYTISGIFLYGNRFNRPCRYYGSPGEEQRGTNVNLFLEGDHFTVDDVLVEAAPCASGMSITSAARDFIVRNSWFAYNGWPKGTTGQGAAPWSDGMTVLRCVNGQIYGNNFVDNTDVDLILGGVPTPDTPNAYCQVHDNTIAHYQNYGFAGIMEECFPNGIPANGDGHFEGATITGNTVSSQRDKLAFGIMVGRHPWGTDTCQVSDAGYVLGNSSTGAVVNLAVDGIDSGSIGQNPTSNAQGVEGFGSCDKSANYTAGHFGLAQVTSGFITRVYDNGTCPQ